MRWPDANRLIDRIRSERPELTVDHYASGNEGQYALRPGRQSVQCISGGTPSTAASLSILAARHA